MLKIHTSEECWIENQIVENSVNFGQTSLWKRAIFLVSRLESHIKSENRLLGGSRRSHD